MAIDWPKAAFYWTEGGVSYASIPFTWELPKVRAWIKRRPGKWIVGGPACQLIPDYFDNAIGVEIQDHMPGILQRVNPLATRTTTGCIRNCPWCGVDQIEHMGLRELEDWPNLPVICDNNLLAASQQHLDRVFERLHWWGWADFNQGLDCRLVTDDLARQIHGIGKPIIRLSLDKPSVSSEWCKAVDMFRAAGVAMRRIKAYVMIGHGEAPADDIDRLQFAKDYLGNPGGVNAMWYHPLDVMRANTVTPNQARRGWTEELRKQTMRWAYGKVEKPALQKCAG